MGQPKLVVFDLETLPDLTKAMQHYTELSDYPGKTMNATTSSIICFGYKIVGEKRARCVSAWDVKSRWNKNVNDDYYVVKEAYKILKDADGIITHNGVKFDMRVLNTRLTYHGFPPLPKIPHMDTCKMARKKLNLINNRLSTVAQHFGCEIKLDTGGWELWTKVMNRIKSAQKLMTKYCKQDVEVTAQIFEYMRPLFSNIPNYNLFLNETENRIEVCPSCGSGHVTKHGLRHTKTRTYQRFQCQNCLSFSTVNVKGEELRSV